ncbi:2'-5' RNA ligase family protein [Streptomyces hoynatensis]|uniref:2'-5' RNA ligase family protein n=1 Tax=Streptomyces hoynatensis TaxID=1141874 RepID=A0A3A9ZEZ4_9ACTN|nr:2'-5' RNA ligase family protein [Streptomyces hoynatensis]RKN46873.1 2'-5' RNA ligase family protein [Streptomyces hoynatensis]
MGTVTLGVSIAVPEPFGSGLQRRRLGFGDAAAAGIPTHVTLLPPTEVEAAARPLIEDHLAAIAAAGRPFPLRLSGTGTFRPLTPVVFVRVAEGGRECGRLQERVREKGGPLARELPFPYHPHVTVAHGIAEEAMDRAQAELAGYEAAWTVGGFSLYEQDGAGVWQQRREFRFPAGPAGGPAGSALERAAPEAA